MLKESPAKADQIFGPGFSEAFDLNIALTVFGLVFVVYALLGLAGGAVLRSMTRRWAAGEHDLASPYGPSMDELDAARDDRREVPA